MASLIRVPGETDAEYNRRCRPLLDLMRSPLFARQIQKMYDNRCVLLDHMKVAELRGSCGVRPKTDDTFTWDVHS
jgi:hypothetical protein